jgi:hypothetical protein
MRAVHEASLEREKRPENPINTGAGGGVIGAEKGLSVNLNRLFGPCLQHNPDELIGIIATLTLHSRQSKSLPGKT